MMIQIHRDVLYYLYRTDGDRTYGSLCDLIFDNPTGKYIRPMRMNDVRRAVRQLEAQGLVTRGGVEHEGVWWIGLTHPEGYNAARDEFYRRHPKGLVKQR